MIPTALIVLTLLAALRAAYIGGFDRGRAFEQARQRARWRSK